MASEEVFVSETSNFILTHYGPIPIADVIVASSTKSQYKSSLTKDLALQNLENTGYFHLKYRFF